MKEYIRKDKTLCDMWNALYKLEDEKEKHDGLNVMRRNDIQAGFEAGQRVVADAPVADVVEVVRCKDCEFLYRSTLGNGMWCTHGRVTEDWFCADGIRRQEET